MTAVTDLQKQRQQDQVQTNFDAAQGYSVTPNQGSVVPNVMQTQSILESMLAAKNAGPNITPPSDAEIRRTSWIASGVMGLLGAIVTGNAASGIEIGMQAALALHDHGYDLRQRAEHVGELHQQGYSALAIEKWYETGDNSELDKERQNMEAMARDEFNSEVADRRQDKEINAANDRQKNQQNFEQGMEGARERFQAEQGRMNRDATLGAQDRADRRQEKQEESQSWAEVRPAVANSQSKQIQLGMAEKDLVNMDAAEKAGDKDAMAAAYNNYREHMGRAIIGGTGMLDSGEITKATGLPDLADAAWNTGMLNFTGMPSADQMKAYHDQTKYDVENETQALKQIATNQYESLVAGGVPLEVASQRVNRMFGGTSIGTNDYAKTQPKPDSKRGENQQEEGNQNDDSGYPEGTVIHNDQTGETMVMHNGKWVKQ
ncbi:hypothetical protein NJ978_000358 [Salmonella enterica]|nr:hypothetical protein [Salmonella enterica]ECF5976300.1 hypothetical protein [Salmonella enterica subsp. arizonae]EDU8174604.1 hypothetical protein [Salmonella enterica subsp. arizonae serovar 41:z4,z23:-]EBE2324190.1 hypothetical protein [Salmonella enterica]EDS3055118.1 hypothetical protein [Salmonella enterica]